MKYHYVVLGNGVYTNTQQQADKLESKIKMLYPPSSVSVIFVIADKFLELYNTAPETSTHFKLVAQPISLGKNEKHIHLLT